ncbi:TlpA disulfide reductase family protein [Arundinibacter roseus]|nr:TlpA disulfide reductase family protein [Arundinibacter roseus]
MKKLLILWLLAIAHTSFAQETASLESTQTQESGGLSDVSTAQPLVAEVKWNALQNILSSSSDTTYVLNFWATWCRPCVAELPHFEAVNRHYASQKVKVVLVSMDFVKDMEDRVIPFVERMKLTNPVWLLNEPDANSWIERVDSTWTGALPATLIINPARSRKVFYEKALDYETLARDLSYFLDY